MRCLRCQIDYPDDLKTCPVDGSRLVAVEEDRIGQMLDGVYHLLDCIGAGRMGAVYRAQRFTDGEFVAVKLRHAGPVPAGELDRFRREAEIARMARHPNLVTVHAGGVTPDNVPFIVMELLEGPSLAAELAANGILPLDRVYEILRQVALALAAAHADRLIHRDLNPANVILHRPTGGTGEIVKVVDFGMAKLDRVDSAGGLVGGDGWIMGTPEYMSPEQCLGHPVDARTDVYSFGVMLFEMLTGTVPFRDASVSHLLLKQISESPPRPRRLRADIPTTLEAFVLRCLSKLPDRRPANFDRVLDELDQIRAGRLLGPPNLDTLVDIPSAWELDDRETLSRCYLRAAFCRRLRVLTDDGEPRPDAPDIGVVMIEMVGWEAWRTRAAPEDLDATLVAVGVVLRRVFGSEALLGHDSETRWLAAVMLPPGSETEATGRRPSPMDRLREQVLDLHRLVRADPVLGALACLRISAGAAVGRPGEPGNMILVRAQDQLRKARAKRVIWLAAPEPTLLEDLDDTLAPEATIADPDPGGNGVYVERPEETARFHAACFAGLDGPPHPVWLIGDPGIGKTRFLEAMRERLTAQGLLCVGGRFFGDANGSRLGTVREALRDAVRATAEADSDAFAAAFGVLGDRVRHDLLSAEGGPVDQAFLIRVVKRLARIAPVALLFDDVHLAPAATLTFLGQLLAATADDRVCAAFAMRPVEFVAGGFRTWRHQVRRLFPGESIVLGSLDLHDVRRIARGLLGDAATEETVHDLMLETEGHPAYLIELVRRMRVTAEPPSPRSLAVSFATESLATDVLGETDARTLDILAHAALVGRRFPFGLIPMLTGEVEAAVESAIETCLARTVLVEESPDTFRFRFPFVRKYLIARLSARRRRRLHRRIAEQMPDVPAWSDTTAAHWLAVGEWEAAWRHGMRAGRNLQRDADPLALARARACYALAEAAAAHGAAKKLETGASAMESEDRVENLVLHTRFRLEYASILTSLGLIDEAERRLVGAPSVPEWSGQVALGHGQLLQARGATLDALEAGYQALALTARYEDDGGRLVALLFQAGLNGQAGHYAIALDQYAQALSRAQAIGNTSAEAHARYGMAAVLHRQGVSLQAWQLVRQAIALSERERGRREIVDLWRARMILAEMSLDWGLADDVPDLLAPVLAGTRAGGYRFLETRALGIVARHAVSIVFREMPRTDAVAGLAGRAVIPGRLFDRARAAVTELADLGGEIGDKAAKTRAVLLESRLTACRGNLPDALGLAQSALSPARELADPVLETRACLILGDIRQQLGQFAAGMYERALDIAERLGHRRLVWHASYRLATLARLQGEDPRVHLDRAGTVLAELVIALPDHLRATAFSRERALTRAGLDGLE